MRGAAGNCRPYRDRPVHVAQGIEQLHDIAGAQALFDIGLRFRMGIVHARMFQLGDGGAQNLFKVSAGYRMLRG